MKSSVIKAATAIVLGAGLFASAVAAPPSLYEEVAIKVNYSDLNIHNEAGAKVLYKRLKDATEEACGMDDYGRVRHLATYSTARECFNTTLTNAVEKIDSDALKDIHAG